MNDVEQELPAVLAGLSDHLHLAKAIGDLARGVDGNRRARCEVCVREWVRQTAGQEAKKILFRLETHRFDNLQQPSIVNALPPPSPASFAIRALDLFLLDHHHVEREIVVMDQVGNTDQFVEEIEELPSPRGFAPTGQLARAAGEVDDPFLARDRIDQANVVVFQQRLQFALDGMEMPGLDFDAAIAAPEVDDKTIDALFEPVARPRVPLLERGVQRLFVSFADATGEWGNWMFRFAFHLAELIRFVSVYPISPDGPRSGKAGAVHVGEELSFFLGVVSAAKNTCSALPHRGAFGSGNIPPVYLTGAI